MAFRLSNNLVGILNFVTFLLSIPILAGGIWLSHHSSTDCNKLFQGPIIAVGVILLVVSFCGLVGACCRNSLLLWIYLFVMFLLIILLFCFTIFAFVVTNKGAGEVVSGRGTRSTGSGTTPIGCRRGSMIPRTGGRSGAAWSIARSARGCRRAGMGIRRWLSSSGRICRRFRFYVVFATFLMNNTGFLICVFTLSFESGCCKPPTDCGFDFQGPTIWNKPTTGLTSNNTDCATWQNNPNGLCYDCQSCKAGFLANFKDDWKKVAIINIIFLVFLVVVYSVGCCALRNNREDYAYPRWKGNP